VRAKYKKSDKGVEVTNRWSKSERKKEIDRRYQSTPKAKALAVIRTARAQKNNPGIQESKRAHDRRYGRSPRGREVNKIACEKYRRTEEGQATRKKNKALRTSIKRYGPLTEKQWAEKLSRLGHACANCGTKEAVQQDHIIPISKGGLHHIDNVQPLCKSCNAAKGDRLNWAS